MAWRGSLSRSVVSTARSSTLRAPPPLPRVRPPPLSAPRRLSFANPRNLGELGCVQSLLPLYSVVAGVRLTSHLAVDVRACCELYNGMEKMVDARRTLIKRRDNDATLYLTTRGSAW